MISYKICCELIHIPTGHIVASGLGTANSLEKKHRNAQPWDIQNTLYKMACKRALVAATLNATAASDIFTQDLEDGIPETSSPKPDPDDTKPKETNFDYITEPQRNRLYAISKKAQISDDKIKAYLKEKYDIESSRFIKKRDYPKICEWAENQTILNAEEIIAGMND